MNKKHLTAGQPVASKKFSRTRQSELRNKIKIVVLATCLMERLPARTMLSGLHVTTLRNRFSSNFGLKYIRKNLKFYLQLTLLNRDIIITEYGPI